MSSARLGGTGAESLACDVTELRASPPAPLLLPRHVLDVSDPRPSSTHSLALGIGLGAGGCVLAFAAALTAYLYLRRKRGLRRGGSASSMSRRGSVNPLAGVPSAHPATGEPRRYDVYRATSTRVGHTLASQIRSLTVGSPGRRGDEDEDEEAATAGDLRRVSNSSLLSAMSASGVVVQQGGVPQPPPVPLPGARPRDHPDLTSL